MFLKVRYCDNDELFFCDNDKLVKISLMFTFPPPDPIPRLSQSGCQGVPFLGLGKVAKCKSIGRLK